MNQKNLCWLDTETTGKYAWKHDVIQLSGLIEIGGLVVDEFNFTCQPHLWENIEEEAMRVHGITEEELRTFDKPIKTWNKLCRILDSHVNKFDKTDKFILAGFNTPFDKDMLYNWWQRCEQQFFGSYFEYKVFDVFPVAFMFAKIYNWDVKDHKLETLCDYLGIPILAHDALSDIKATRELYCKLVSALPDEWSF